ncbi:4'-phosphopantetheinyl transferase family protein [Lysinibacillus sp. NPDC056185]|uniref:4'-phosphopantetheinyl transferase family protein n=1 Tax=Lysinibacillus sp. NPDC056185 TaxID=3345739 RepID=UPI0039EEC2D0
MIELFAMNINNSICFSTYKQLMQFLPQKKQDKLKKFTRIEDSIRGLFAEILIRNIIIQQKLKNNFQFEFATNPYGKPYLSDVENFYFNLSHSGDWVICAINSNHIGIDIEKEKFIDITLAKQFFTEKECDYIFSLENYQLNRFFEIWTLKESYIKAIGIGLSLPLNSFSIIKDSIDQNFIIESQFQDRKFYLKNYLIDSTYQIAVCARNYDFPSDIKYVDPEDLVIEALNNSSLKYK